MTTITFEKGPETNTDVLVNVWCDGRRAGTISFTKETWKTMEDRGIVEVYVGSLHDA